MNIPASEIYGADGYRIGVYREKRGAGADYVRDCIVGADLVEMGHGSVNRGLAGIDSVKNADCHILYFL